MCEQAEFYQNFSQLAKKLENATQRIEHLKSKLEEVMMTSYLKLDELRKMPLPAVKVNQLTTPQR